ncbi:putative mannosyltransferase-like protein [Trypanosoma grayi]|uniref:putative mannosyltransferase-like protein n=1 Tax=Trypanosoma grayi TaxID=71804 RepID=UPI0004F4758A|nr:putative mannosyltransferase-like protein [Trypanosoma grayi]KEG06153.1 putative mannosyltransferase-like protein [Trypanosoma grayi]
MREAVGYLRPLTERYAVALLSSAKSGFCSDAKGAELAVLQLTDESQVEVLFKSARATSVWREAYTKRRKVVFMHTRGNKYEKIHRDLRHKADYFIGRSLSESSRVPENWIDGMRRYADEVWATGDFFKSVYRSAGVEASKIHVVPEALNVHLYNPRLCTQELPSTLLAHAYTNMPQATPGEARRRFRFLAVMKWEWRKGWDVLLEAYWRAFGPSSPLHNEVSLYMKVKWLPKYADGINDENIGSYLAKWAARLPGFTSMQDFPHLVVMSGGKYVSEEELRRMYCSADAFVLPTRGEGWGLPATEAMAMGVPVLTTNWGGTTAFMEPNATFAIPVDGLEEVPRGMHYAAWPGNKWAMPSVNGTAELMRYVVQHREHARAVGQRGRQLIEEKFSEEAVADVIDKRLGEITKNMNHRFW